ncbi:hypothetical protein [Catenulispora pinisilvae]|uniref:hypothetical protein n=1 Tax=Catenulispora pinisilvae TaxID=2705253 RepID=UPI001891A7C7|nr:hypothetical protein [Catenulispora pinisilvae]
MTHFASPDDEFLPLEDEPVPGLDDMMLAEGIEPLGLSLVSKDLTFTLVIFALMAGIDAEKWWSR